MSRRVWAMGYLKLSEWKRSSFLRIGSPSEGPLEDNEQHEEHVCAHPESRYGEEHDRLRRLRRVAHGTETLIAQGGAAAVRADFAHQHVGSFARTRCLFREKRNTHKQAVAKVF